MAPVQTVAFVLLLLGMLASWFLLARFVKRLSATSSSDPQLVGDLSRLLLAGSGGIKGELRALGYLLSRSYAKNPDETVVGARDQVLAAWCATLFLVVVNACALGWK